MIWTEKYRPQQIKDCILPKELTKVFRSIVRKKEIPNMLLCGTSGVGKTTVAKALCKQLDSEFIFINGSDESGIDTLRTKIKTFASTVSMNDKRKVVIIDEADFMNANSLQPALRGAIEEFSANCSFIFTCNHKNKIIPALHSRCTVLDFKIPKEEKLDVAKQLIERTKMILENESVEYDVKTLQTLAVKFFPDFRRLINELQKYANSNGKIDEHILSNLSDIDVDKVYKALKTKNYTALREWTVENNNNDPNNLFRKLYDSLQSHLTPQSIPQAVILIGDWQYKAAFGDPEICLLACLTEILASCEVK